MVFHLAEIEPIKWTASEKFFQERRTKRKKNKINEEQEEVEEREKKMDGLSHNIVSVSLIVFHYYLYKSLKSR